MASQQTCREQTEQERLIAQKKQELLQRIQAKKQSKSPGMSSSSTSTSLAASNFETASQSSGSRSQSDVKPAMFMNDGNFLERFKQMQQQQQGKQPTEPFTSSGQARNTISLKLSSVKKTSQLVPKPVSSKVAEVFEKDNQSDHVSPPEGKAEVIDVVDKVAAIVAAGGEMVEKLMKSKNEGNPQYSFLFNEGSEEHKNYQRRIAMYKQRAAATQSSSSAGSSASAEPTPSSSSSLPQAEQASGSSTQGRRKRRSRWGEGADSALNAAAAAVAAVEQQALMTTQEQVEREKQRREQEEIQAMYMSIVAKKRAAEVQSKSNKPKYEYDSDEETDGGTWEHKKRKKEMQKTSEEADQLTSMNKGKHFIGDFLPKEELDKFLKKVRAIKGGEEVDLSDYSEHKIKEDNVGYKLLQKAGWKEGEGLGAEGKGITAPISKGKVSLDSSGLGTEKPHEVQQQDDEFDTFRKRMMLAYRFRPNPLNNPRRPYY